MDITTFLELPLDRELYQPKEFRSRRKEPIRVLVTEASSKIAYSLIYKICTGDVFGPDQDVILHLLAAKSSSGLHSRLGELLGCGFGVLVDTFVSSEPAKTYKNVDVVVLIAPFEQITGYSQYSAFAYQFVKTRQVAKNVEMYAKPGARVVIGGPSTKGIIVLLACFTLFGANLPTDQISGVTCLDITITKALLAAKLKTTTDRIKNVVIWGTTHPDVHNATVLTCPPEDKAQVEQEIPVIDALQDDNWLNSEFILKIAQREVDGNLLKHGKAVGSAIARHLKLLFQGPAPNEEIISMGVIIPADQPYGVEECSGFSMPVIPGKGSINICRDLGMSVTTHLMNIRAIYRLKNEPSMRETATLITYIQDYEKKTKKEYFYAKHEYSMERVLSNPWFLKFVVSPTTEGPRHYKEKDTRHISSKKSITWEEILRPKRSFISEIKSLLRINGNVAT